ncbi:MAG: 16S rRNA (guanine(527)-N(7))-methyltransferase RsmG [Methylococcales bacterium]|nr:16S rRNA (guanine(527)-N(7))-methyltransferase RsmG [Methylococcales bacterium]
MVEERDFLIHNAQQLGVTVTQAQAQAMLKLLDLLAKWNKAYNLTAIVQRDQMLVLHLLDSLAVSPYLEGRNIVDVGTGAGLPGLPLAMVRPELSFTLLDSNAKKIRFIRQAVIELGLANVNAVQARVEAFQPPALFDTVLTRAFALLPEIVSLTWPLLAPGGVSLAMKARPDELNLAPSDVALETLTLKLPGTDLERCLIRIRGKD